MQEELPNLKANTKFHLEEIQIYLEKIQIFVEDIQSCTYFEEPETKKESFKKEYLEKIIGVVHFYKVQNGRTWYKKKIRRKSSLLFREGSFWAQLA